MSAIGDYIHLRQSNYIKYGTNRNTPSSTYLEERSRILSNLFKEGYEIKQSQQYKFYQQLEDYLNSLRDLKSSQEGQKYAGQAGQYIAKSWNQYFTQDTSLNFNNFTVEQLDKKCEKSLKKIELSEKGLFPRKASLINMVNELNELNNMIGKTKDLDAEQELNKFFHSYKKIYSFLKKEQKNNKAFKQITYSDLSEKAGQDLIQMVKDANKIIEKYFSTPPKALIEGDFFEAFLAAALSGGQILGQDYIQETHNLVFSKDPNINIDIENIEKTLDTKVFTANTGKSSLKIQRDIKHRRKVDIIANWGLEKINISAKNISSNMSGFTRLSFVSGSPMDIMLGGISEEFINHYLNLKATGNPEGENKIASQTINFDMKLALIRQAISGAEYTSRKDIADTLIINDKATGKIKVLSVNQMIQRMFPTKIGGELQKASPIVNNASVQANGKSISNLKFKNIFKEGSVNQRINYILQQLHDAKISVALNVNLNDL